MKGRKNRTKREKNGKTRKNTDKGGFHFGHQPFSKTVPYQLKCPKGPAWSHKNGFQHRNKKNYFEWKVLQS